MARTLIVGCGCRGQALARKLIETGHAVRGTTRRDDRVSAIEAAGAEAVVADPNRLGTLTPTLEGVSVLCWLLAGATGEAEAVAALHGPRLESMLDAIVDTPVRGIVYEAAGAVDPEVTARGAAIVRRAAETHQLPAEVIAEASPDHGQWLNTATGAIEAVLTREHGRAPD